MRLPIQPTELFSGEIDQVQTSKLTHDDLKKLKSVTSNSFEIKDAMVAFLDILGFSDKKDEEEIDACFTDFPNPLIRAAKKYEKVRFNLLGDSAILAADIKDAGDLIAATRSAFQYWIADCILVRGGISRGTYVEKMSWMYESASSNFRGYIVTGFGVAKAVKLEAKNQPHYCL